MRPTEFANECFYHVFTRGVDQRVLFSNDEDRFRFLCSLYIANDSRIQFERGDDDLKRLELLSTHEVFSQDRDALVHIIAYCLMDNHFHLLLEQVQEQGISKFMHKLLVSHAKYFNTRYERQGTLFNRPYKAVAIESDVQLEHVPAYIHLNVLDRVGLSWRDGNLQNWEEAQKVLEGYPWSSYLTYVGKEANWPRLPILHLEHAMSGITTGEGHIKQLKEWSWRYLPDFR